MTEGAIRVAHLNRIALAPALAQDPPMLARVLSEAVNGIEAFPVEGEVNSGWGGAVVVLITSFSPILNSVFSWGRELRD
jgi:hypothetical protein